MKYSSGKFNELESDFDKLGRLQYLNYSEEFERILGHIRNDYEILKIQLVILTSIGGDYNNSIGYEINDIKELDGIEEVLQGQHVEAIFLQFETPRAFYKFHEEQEMGWEFIEITKEFINRTSV